MAQPRRYHFIGICGTAMGAVAAAIKRRGDIVSGSDHRVYPPMSTYLAEAGVDIISGFRAQNIPDDAEVIVIGNAMSRGNPEVEEVLNRKLRYVSLPEVLKTNFLGGKRNFVVTGTHGKTTTTSILTWLMESSGRNPSHMIGGIPRNMKGGARFTDSEFTVLEGDEYDTAFFDKRSKFVHYLPECVVVGNIEFDHADIFDTLAEIKTSFRRLLNIVPGNGIVFFNADDASCREVSDRCPAPTVSVGLGEKAERRITEIELHSEESRFVLDGERYSIRMAGEYNVRNAAMAACAASFAGLTPAEIRRGLDTFEGIARRMELRGETQGRIRIVDDFGHHPSAIRQAITAVRQRWPSGRVWAVFEPRSNTSRRNIFQCEFAAALKEADGAMVAAIADPDKFLPEQRLDPERVVAEVRAAGREAYFEPSADAIVQRLGGLVQPGDTVVVFSNGGFDNIHDKLLAAL